MEFPQFQEKRVRVPVLVLGFVKVGLACQHKPVSFHPRLEEWGSHSTGRAWGRAGHKVTNTSMQTGP